MQILLERCCLRQVIRIEVDDRNEKVNAKIRDAELEKVPYILVVGDKEILDHSVSVRKRKRVI